MTPTFEKQILVAGVGNAWLQDDAFGGECARRLEARGVPSGVTVSDPAPKAEADSDVRGEERVVVEGRTFSRGGQVVLRPERNRNAQDHLLDGRSATIERIYIDYDDQVHLCVTVDDDPGQDIMRDIGRYLYFKPTEVEVIGA